MLVDGLHGVIANFNAKALFEVSAFRQRMADRSPHPFDADFFRTRADHPYFGYVLVQNDGCDDFWMISHDDDLVAQHYFWYGQNGYEPLAVASWVERARTAHLVFDVGAFSGVYALLSHFTNPEARIHVFEPTARASSRALDNCRVNMALDRTTVHRLALSDGPRRVEINHFRGNHELGSGASYVAKPAETIHGVELCEASTLDEMCAAIDGAPDLVKIDVEEAEVDVLRGGEELIRSKSASFLVEVVPKTCSAVIELLHGYRCHVIDEQERSLVPLDGTRQSLIERVERHGFVNVLFDPQDPHD